MASDREACDAMCHPLLDLEVASRGEMTHYGGLVLAQQLVRRLGVAQRLDRHLHLFKRHAPYCESDHVLALAYTLYADGTCFGGSGGRCRQAVRRLVGVCRIPDPTTAGDFLRRFRSAAEVEQLSAAIDEIQEEAWSKLPDQYFHSPHSTSVADRSPRAMVRRW